MILAQAANAPSAIVSIGVPLVCAAISVISAVLAVILKRRMDEAATRFTWLHEARAKAMMDIYARSIDIEESVRNLLATREWRPSEKMLNAIEERIDAVQSALKHFDACYKPSRLLFSADLSKALDDLSALYATIPTAYFGAIDPDEYYQGVQLDALEAVAKNLPQTDALIRKLETEFRKLYGSDRIARPER